MSAIVSKVDANGATDHEDVDSEVRNIEFDSVEEEAMVEDILSSFQEEFNENPRMIRFMSVTCLRFRHHSVQRAKKRLSNYIKWRRKEFGDLSDQTCPEDGKLQEQLSSGFIRLSPIRLSTGSALVYVTMNKHNPKKFNADDTVRMLHYIIIGAMKRDPYLAKNGFVMINNMEGAGLSNLDINVPKAMSDAINQALPIRINSFAVWSPPFVVRFMIPIVRAILSSKLGQRLYVVDKSTDFEEHMSLTAEYLPSEFGGMIHQSQTSMHTQQIISEAIMV